VSNVTWFPDAPPFPGTSAWEYSGNSGASYVPYTGAIINQVLGPTGTQRFRASFFVPSGAPNHMTIAWRGDIHDGTVNQPSELWIDGAFVAMGGNSTTAVFTASLPTPAAGAHTVEIRVGAADDNGPGTFLTSVDVDVFNSIPCACCALPELCGTSLVEMQFDAVAENTPGAAGWSQVNLFQTADGVKLTTNISGYNSPGNPPPSPTPVVDYTFTTPQNYVRGVRLWNQCGGNLGDSDGLSNTTVVTFLDASNNVLYTGNLSAGNGAAPFTTLIPSGALLNGVKTVRLSNLGKQSASSASPLWRELQALQVQPAYAHLCCEPVVGATYEIDWYYAHRARSGSETAQLRIGDAANPLGTNPIIDTHNTVPANGWTLRSGTVAIGAGFPSIRMEFQALAPGGSVGNFLDACSVVLRRVLPTPANFGEQLTNGGFENTGGGPGTVTFPPTSTPGSGWSTTDGCACLEIWGTGAIGVPSFAGVRHAEMNAFVNGTLFQNAALETCENLVTWYDGNGNKLVPADVTPCPVGGPALYNPFVTNLVMTGAFFGDGPDPAGENICAVVPAPSSTTHFAAPSGGCYDPDGLANPTMTWTGPLNQIELEYGNLPQSSGGVQVNFNSAETGLLTWPVNGTPMVAGEERTSNPTPAGGYAVLRYISGPVGVNAPKSASASNWWLHQGSTDNTTPPIRFRLTLFP
jgi:hypothetical protein